MSFEKPLWGAPHIHGELLILGFDVAQSMVSKYMVPRRGRPSKAWKTFLRNHGDGIASIDLFVVPMITERPGLIGGYAPCLREGTAGRS